MDLATVPIVWLGIAAGGALGTLCRVGIGHACSHWIIAPFPLGTLIVNLLGCFGLGWMGTWAQEQGASAQHAWLPITAGFFGGLTTFSTWMFELHRMAILERSYIHAMLYFLAATSLGAIAMALGSLGARRW